MDDTRTRLGKRMKYLRKRKGLSAEAFSEYLGVSPATLRRYESGQTEPDAEIAARLAKLFGVSADDLLGVPENEWVNLFPYGEVLSRAALERTKKDFLKELK